jgi:hypothetical protein
MVHPDDRAFEFTHEGINFQCRIESDAEHAADDAARGGRWVVEVGGSIHALCEAMPDDSVEAIRERAVAVWSERRGPMGKDEL